MELDVLMNGELAGTLSYTAQTHPVAHFRRRGANHAARCGCRASQPRHASPTTFGIGLLPVR